MTGVTFRGPGLNGSRKRTHIRVRGTATMVTSALPCCADLAQVKLQRVYLPQGTLPWLL